MKVLVFMLVVAVAAPAKGTEPRASNPLDGLRAVSLELYLGGPGDGSSGLGAASLITREAEKRIISRMTRQLRKGGILVKDGAPPFRVAIYGRQIHSLGCDHLAVYAVALYLWNQVGSAPPDVDFHQQWDSGWIDLARISEIEARVSGGLRAELEELLQSRLPPGDPGAPIPLRGSWLRSRSPEWLGRIPRDLVPNISASFMFGAGLGPPGQYFDGDVLGPRDEVYDEVASRAIDLLRKRFSPMAIEVDKKGENFIAGAWGRKVRVDGCAPASIFILSFSYWGEQPSEGGDVEFPLLWEEQFVGAAKAADAESALLDAFAEIVDRFASAISK